MKNTDVRRSTIQTTIAPAIETALAGIEKLDMSRPEDMRRLFRALVHLGSARLLDAGCPPALVANFALEAVGREVEARQNAIPVEAAPQYIMPVATA